MERLVSVITPVGPGSTRYLSEAYASLCDQVGVAWEWIVQFDGDASVPSPLLPDDSRVRAQCTGLQVGAAATRNLALERCAGGLVFNLDADDVLAAPDVLARLDSTLGASRAAFAFGRVAGIDDPEEVDWPSSVLPLSDGEVVEPGALEPLWREIGVPPIAGSSVLWDKRYLLAYGGWAALYGSEDTAVILAVAQRHPVVFADLVVLLYRRHDAQTTAGDDYLRLRPAHWSFVHQRLVAMRRIHGETVPAECATVPVPVSRSAKPSEG